MAKIQFFREKCIGCGACVQNAPQYWEISSQDGKSILKGGRAEKGIFIIPIMKEEISEQKKVVQDCPMHIIKILA